MPDLPWIVNSEDTAGTLRYVPLVALIRIVTVEAREKTLVVYLVVFHETPPVLIFALLIYTRYVALEKPVGAVQVACTLLLLISLRATLEGGPGSE